MGPAEDCLSRLWSCFERILGKIQRERDAVELNQMQNSHPACICDQKQKGTQVQVSRYCVSGEGTALATVDVEQAAAFWEVEVVAQGKFRVGLAQKARSKEDLKRLDGQIGDKVRSWAIGSTSLDLKEKDVIGVYFDQRELPTLKLTLNGEWIDEQRFVKGIKGEVRPAVSVSGGAMLTFKFDAHSFKFPPKEKQFTSIIPSRSII